MKCTHSEIAIAVSISYFAYRLVALRLQLQLQLQLQFPLHCGHLSSAFNMHSIVPVTPAIAVSPALPDVVRLAMIINQIELKASIAHFCQLLYCS